jgi:hypothetical protein
MSPDSFDADLRGAEPAAEGRQRILLETLDRGVRADEAIDRLRRALPGATFTSIDEATGVFEIEVEASDLEDGVGQVFDAIARAGADDHVVIAEHADIPGHWVQRGKDQPLPPPAA